MKLFVALLSVVGLAGPLVAADFSRAARGTSAAVFLAQPVDARSAALGGASAATAENADALTLNPAALSRVEKFSASFSHAPDLEASSLQQAAAALRRGKWSFAGGARTRTAGRMDETDASGLTVGDFRPNDVSVSLGAALTVGSLALGASVKTVRSSLRETAQTAAADLGILWRPDGDWSAGATLTNLGGRLTYDQEPEPLPLAAAAGVQRRWNNGWRLAADVTAPRDDAPFLSVGAERTWSRAVPGVLAIRAGYNGRSASAAGGAQGATIGLGWIRNGLSVDYAFLPAGDLGQAHRITLGWNY
jgi:hypothetical protein